MKPGRILRYINNNMTLGRVLCSVHGQNAFGDRAHEAQKASEGFARADACKSVRTCIKLNFRNVFADTFVLTP